MVVSELHDYQHVAVDFLRGQDRAALMMDMGLGKTACVLSALEPRHLPALIVAPKRVAVEVWGVEQARWRPDLPIDHPPAHFTPFAAPVPTRPE